MNNVIITGIDPGLVHTGVVTIDFPHKYEDDQNIYVKYRVFENVDEAEIADYIDNHTDSDHIFIEDYDMRNNFNTDKAMAGAVERLKNAIPRGQLINNAGVNTLVPAGLMRVFDVWSFPVATNHNDLRSAARIALLGMLKDEVLREILSDIVSVVISGYQINVKKEHHE